MRNNLLEFASDAVLLTPVTALTGSMTRSTSIVCRANHELAPLSSGIFAPDVPVFWVAAVPRPKFVVVVTAPVLAKLIAMLLARSIPPAATIARRYEGKYRHQHPS